jgi:hypothetical protein
MTTTARLTTNIGTHLMQFISEQAKILKVTHRQVIETAITFYAKESRKKKMLASYNEMAEDEKEMQDWVSVANNPHNL